MKRRNNKNGLGPLLQNYGWPVRELLEIELIDELDKLNLEREKQRKKRLTRGIKDAKVLKLVSGTTKKKRGQ